MAGTQINLEEARQSAQKIGEAAQNLQQQKTKLTRIVEEIESHWQGQAHSKFQSVGNELLRDLAQANQRVSEIHEAVKSTIAGYEAQDQA